MKKSGVVTSFESWKLMKDQQDWAREHGPKPTKDWIAWVFVAYLLFLFLL